MADADLAKFFKDYVKAPYVVGKDDKVSLYVGDADQQSGQIEVTTIQSHRRLCKDFT